MSFKILSPRSVEESYHRIKNHVVNTRVVESREINNKTGHRIKFKLDNEQVLGSFKIRGVINTLLKLKEEGSFPDHFVAYSTGNHAKAVAYASDKLGCKSTIVMPKNVSLSKQKAPTLYNANIIITDTRSEAEELVTKIASKGAYLIHPSENDLVISGNGTACYEALQEVIKTDAIFAPCGGGGIVSGSFLAAKLFSNNIKIFAAEPEIANDAHLSVQNNKIFRFKESPNTIADGARTLSITPRILHYLKQIDGFFEITEKEIIECMIDINKMLDIICEPTSALALAAAYRWLATQKTRREVVVIVTGSNIDQYEFNEIVTSLNHQQHNNTSHNNMLVVI